MWSSLFKVLGAAVLVVACTSASFAARTGGFSLTSEAGLYFFDNEENLKDATLSGVRIGYDVIGKDLTDSIGIELLLGYAQPESEDTAVKADVYLMRLDAIFPIAPTSKWVPFFAVGAGALRKEIEADTETRSLVSFGAGLKYYIANWLLLRADARQNMVFVSGDSRNNFELTGGVGLVFDFAKAPVQKVEAIKDADGDGIQDKDDTCPDTPKGVKVNRKGCPVDSDRDGVFDYLDKCPETREGAKVDVAGCPEIPDIKIPEQVEGAAPATDPPAESSAPAPAEAPQKDEVVPAP